MSKSPKNFLFFVFLMFSKTNLIMKSLKCGKSRHSNIKQRKVDEQTGWWRENGGQRPGVVQPSGVCLRTSVCVCALASLVSWYGGENDLDYQDWYQSHTHGHAPTASPAHMLTLSPCLSGAFWFALGSIQSLQLKDSSPSLVCVCGGLPSNWGVQWIGSLPDVT